MKSENRNQFRMQFKIINGPGKVDDFDLITLVINNNLFHAVFK